MLNTIIWATDGSENAARALPWAKELLSGDAALLIAVHIVETGSPAGSEGQMAANGHQADPVRGLRRLVSGLSEQGLNVALRIAHSIGPQPAQGIADIAREVDADAIVIGTHGRSPMRGLVLGSVAQRLLQIAPCPVLSVSPAVQSRDSEETDQPAEAS